MNARAIFAVLWMLSCGVAADPSNSGFMGRAYPGTPSGDDGRTGVAGSGGAGGGQAPTGNDDTTPGMSNTNVCGDGGICSTVREPVPQADAESAELPAAVALQSSVSLSSGSMPSSRVSSR
jgi:hypothetical protein